MKKSLSPLNPRRNRLITASRAQNNRLSKIVWGRKLVSNHLATACTAIVMTCVLLITGSRCFVQADDTAQAPPFSQNWTTTTLITANDNWPGVPGIEGFL